MIPVANWMIATPHLIPAIGLSMAFAFLAWGVRAVTAAAAITGVLLSVVVCLAAGPAALLPIVTVFLLTVISTRVGRAKKERLGTAERRHGRSTCQILANVAPTAICAAPLLFFPYARYILLAGAAAALAEAAGDTVSSELGQAFGGTPRMILGGRRVATGTNGAITLAGTLLSVLAIVLVAWSCEWAGMLLPRFYPIVLSSAFAGTLVDSLLGATLERPGRLGNDAVNFSSNAFAAALAIALLFVQRWM